MIDAWEIFHSRFWVSWFLSSVNVCFPLVLEIVSSRCLSKNSQKFRRRSHIGSYVWPCRPFLLIRLDDTLHFRLAMTAQFSKLFHDLNNKRVIKGKIIGFHAALRTYIYFLIELSQLLTLCASCLLIFLLAIGLFHLMKICYNISC